MKKIASILLVLTLLLGCVMALSACGGEDSKPTPTKTVMNISMNPEVEFVLDADNKVISVNALNEEGNLIISAETFVGKDANEAAKLFISVSKDLGFVVEANANVQNNDINISISGDKKLADELYNSVKGKIDEYIQSANITIKINQAEAITKEQLEVLLAECAPYLEEAEIKAMEYEALVDAIYESRKETAEYYSEELKKAYYEAKAFAMEQAEFEVIKEQLGLIESAAFDAVNNMYISAVEELEELRMTTLVNEDSPYQVALKTFREKKAEYLKYREEIASLDSADINEAKLQMLETLDNAVAETEALLLQAGVSANQGLDNAKAAALAMRDQAIATIKTYAALASEHATEISEKQTAAKAEFFTKFETDYKAAIEDAEANWNGMREEIKTKAQN